jgi:hypothetical protein
MDYTDKSDPCFSGVFCRIPAIVNGFSETNIQGKIKETVMLMRMVLFLFVIIFIPGCTGPNKEKTAKPNGSDPTSRRPEERCVQMVSDTYIQWQLDKLAPVRLDVDLSHLAPEDLKVLRLLVQASQCMDLAFLRQVYEWYYCIHDDLVGSEDPGDQNAFKLFNIMFGPWNRLDKDLPFLESIPKPPGANFYPMDMTRENFSAWLEAHPEDREAFESNFTMIRRDNDRLVAIPYSSYFEEQLIKAAGYLKEAARITKDPSLKAFLLSRAEAFFSNDYYQSDMDWMDLSGDIELVIGPYEVYEDKLFGYKAAFQSFVCVVDPEESDKLKRIGKHLNEMEAYLPIPEAYKNFERGTSSPIKVVHEVYSAGDTKAGIQTSAFNLPNDERVREAKGSKKVLLKNVMNAKFEKCWIPIVTTVLTDEALRKVSFEGYFNHVLMHELSHGLGPGKIRKDGRETLVSKELKEVYSTIEECKADVLGLYLTPFLIDRGVLPKALEETLYGSYLGGMFRSIRFGIESAHGGGVAIQMNYHLDRGGFGVDKQGLFYVDENKIKEATPDLAKKLLTLQAEGDYKGAKAFIAKYRVIRPELQAALDKLENVPVDILPIYPIEEEILKKRAAKD